MKILGIILTLVLTVPIILFDILLIAIGIERERRERPGYKPTKDEWKGINDL